MLLWLCVAAVSLCSCGVRVPYRDLSKESPQTLESAKHVRVVTLDSGASLDVAEVIGPIEAWSVQHMTWDPHSSKSDALLRLKIEAVHAGADGVIEVTFDSAGTDAMGSNTWNSVKASGTAVKINKSGLRVQEGAK